MSKKLSNDLFTFFDYAQKYLSGSELSDLQSKILLLVGENTEGHVSISAIGANGYKLGIDTGSIFSDVLGVLSNDETYRALVESFGAGRHRCIE